MSRWTPNCQQKSPDGNFLHIKSPDEPVHHFLQAWYWYFCNNFGYFNDYLESFKLNWIQKWFFLFLSITTLFFCCFLFVSKRCDTLKRKNQLKLAFILIIQHQLTYDQRIIIKNTISSLHKMHSNWNRQMNTKLRRKNARWEFFCYKNARWTVH